MVINLCKTMLIRRVQICFFFIFFMMPPLQAATVTQLEQYFQNELARIQTKHDTQVEALRKYYVKKLEHERDKAQKVSDSERVLVIEKELEHIATLDTLPIETQDDKGPLQQYKNILRKELIKLKQEWGTATYSVFESYHGILTKEAESLEKNGQNKAATLFRIQVAELYYRDTFSKAQAALGKFKTIDHTERKARSAMNEEERAVIHPRLWGEPGVIRDSPVNQAHHFKIEIYHPKAVLNSDYFEPVTTTTTIRENAGGLSLQQVLQESRREESNNSNSPLYYHQMFRDYFTVRTMLKAPEDQPTNRFLVVFDIFNEIPESRIEGISGKQILVPPLEAGQMVVVDSGSKVLSRSVSSTDKRKGSPPDIPKFYFIISIFDVNGELLIQRLSHPSLRKIARFAL